MKTDRMLDRFVAIFVAVVMLTLGYMAWVVHTMGASWFHLYWVGLGAWGFYVLFHVENVIGAARKQEFRELVDDWVRRGSPDEPIDTRRGI
jgi:fatty acid desaturase